MGYGEIRHFRGSSKSRICIPSKGHSNPNKAIEYNSLHGKYRKMARRLRTIVREILPRGERAWAMDSWPQGPEAVSLLAGRSEIMRLTRSGLGACRPESANTPKGQCRE